MPRITTQVLRRRSLFLAMAVLVAVAAPVQAAATKWIKTFDREGEAQGLAAAPNGDIYVADSPTQTGATAAISRYTGAGGRVWETSLGTGGWLIRGLASDAAGNAYVSIWHSSPTVDGYQYELQQVKPNGKLGWDQSWYDADASLAGQVVAVRGTTVFVAERDATTTTTTIRRFATADGDPLPSWTLSGPKAPTDRPTQLVVSAQGTYLIDLVGGVLRLKSDGTVQWRATVPGKTGRGSMGVDSAGLSVAYDASSTDLRVRRLSLAGVKKWDKPVPGSASSIPVATSVGGQTYTVGSPYLTDTLQVLLVAHLDANGKQVGKVTISTPKIDSAFFALPVGDHLFMAGFAWANNPLIARVPKP